jgi:hypothetical protein
MHSVGRRAKTLITLLGTVVFRRSLYVCPACGKSLFPADRALDVEHTGFSPGVRRMMTRAGSRTSFADAEDDLRVYARVHVHRRDIERIAEHTGRQIEGWNATLPTQPPPGAVPASTLYVSFDGTAVPMRRGELLGRKGKQPDGSAKGREVKVGCVFTQTTCSDEGYPVRDEDSTTYVAGIESSTLFGDRIYTEALRRGVADALTVVVLTDGAAYNKTIAQTHFPQAVHIIDLYHAREHLHALTALVVRTPLQPPTYERWKDRLDQGAVDHLIRDASRLLPRQGPRRRDALKEIRYFQKNAAHMRYALFRSRGFFVGSGVIEAGCRTLVGQRLKNAGMFWSRRGAHSILQARCCLLSHRFNHFWDDRAAA